MSEENNELINIAELTQQINKDNLFQIIKTDQSFHEGTGVVKDYISKAKELGLKNLVLADRNSLTCLVGFYQKCKENDINPIIGNTLSLDFPMLDIRENLIRNNSAIEEIQNLKNISGNYIFQKINFKEVFSTEENFEKLEEIQSLIAKYYRSTSGSKEIALLRELNDIMQEIDKDFELVNEDTLSLWAANLKKFPKTYKVEPEVKNVLNLEELNKKLLNIDLELTTTDLLVMAKNEEGYQNIKELISLAYLEGQGKVKVEVTQDKVKRNIDSHASVTIEHLKQHLSGVNIYLGDSKDSLGRSILDSGEDGVNVINTMKDIFGDSLCLYLKNSTKGDNPVYVEREKVLNSRLLELSSELSIPCIGTHDARFINEEDYEIHDVKRAILLKQNVNALSRKKEEYKGQYLISNEELMNKFQDYPELLLNNQTISSNTDIYVRLNKSFLPNFNIPEEFSKNTLVKECNKLSLNTSDSLADMKNNLIEYYTPEIEEKFKNEKSEWDYEKENKINNIVSGAYMKSLAWEGVESKMKVKFGEEKWSELRDSYKERADYESKIVNDMGFPGYFLIVQEFINWGKQEGVPVGPGRGSGAGSLLAFGLSITTLDPIKDNLLFERFLNPERVSMPDFDIDFGDGFDKYGNKVGRGTVINHVKELYANLKTNKPTVSQIATNGVFKPKSAIKAAAKTLGHTIPFENNLTDMVPDDPDFKFAALFEEEEFQLRYEKEPEFKKIIDIAEKLVGNKQNSGVHAGGVVIAPSDLNDFSPLMCAPDGTGLVTQFDKNDVETAGMVKFDFLGLKTLSVLMEALKRITENDPSTVIDLDLIDESDEKTFAMLRKAQTHAVFQIESDGMTQLVEELQVDNIGEISDLLALYRPGPMQSGMMAKYVAVRKQLLQVREETGKNIKDIKISDVDKSILTEDELSAFTAIHPDLLENLAPTNNQMIYQEQVMEAGQTLAGYSLGGADMLRRAMGKKKLSEMISQKKMFINGAFNNYREYWKEITGKSDKAGNVSIDVNLAKFAEPLELTEYLENDEGRLYLSNAEKVVKLFKDYVGYSDEKIELLEAKISNYKVRDFKDDHLAAVYEALKNKCQSKGFSEKDTKEAWMSVYYSLSQFVRLNQVFSAIEKFAAYGFNKSHSLAYATVSYQTAFLKANYPVEFYASTLTFQHDDLDKIAVTAADAKKHFGIKVLAADVNDSEYLFKPYPKKDSIRYGLNAIKGLGNNGNRIFIEREENGDFTSLEDLLYRVQHRNILLGAKNPKLNVRCIEGLAHSGALDCLIPDYILENDLIEEKREYIVHKYHNIMEGNYPAKKDIEKMVPIKNKTGKYPEEFFYTPNPEHNNEQKLLAEELAYTRVAEIVHGKPEVTDKGKKKYPAVSKPLMASMKKLNNKVDLAIEGMKDGKFKATFNLIKNNLVDSSKVEKIHNLVKEKEFTGLFLSEHPVHVDDIKNNVRLDPKKSLYDINQITPEKSGNKARIVGVVNEVREILIKNGNNAGQKMAIVIIEDETTTLSCTFFSDAYAVAKNYLVKNNLLVIDGEITYNDQYGLGFKTEGLQSKIPEDTYISLVSDQQKKQMKRKMY
jgi:DNA-directed DNA polymerase III PolC